MPRKTKPRSLRITALMVLGMALITFTAACIIITRRVMPGILLIAEGRRLAEHLDALNGLVLALAGGFLIFVLSLYLIMLRYFLFPIESLSRDIHKVTTTALLDTGRYSAISEFRILSASINNMLEKLNQSTLSTNVFKGIFNGMGAYLFVSDLETDEILFINDSFMQLYSIDDRVIGRRCWEILHPGATGRCDFCPIPRLLENKTGVEVWEYKSGINGHFYKNTDRLIEWNNNRLAHLQHSVDISELVAAREQAEQSNRAKSTFLATMSHEMRTPMNAIIGMTAIAETSREPEKMEYCLSKINEASTHLLAVINNILDMSKIESGKFELSYSEFDFEKMLRRTADVMNFKIAEKKQRFILQIDERLPRFIVADEQRLAQVVTNLLSNAVKFTPEEGTITLKVEEREGREKFRTLRIEVRDSGIGIARDKQARLFSLFEQADGSIARKFGGTGLGLAICKSIVELMGGEIWVQSEEGQGAAFGFEITVEQGGEEGAAEEAGGEEARQGGAFAGKTILLAEDVEINREIVLTLLEDTGAVIECAENGSIALNLFREAPGKYSLILMDLHMPEMDGLEATRRIRAFEAEQAPVLPKRIPILAMTANVFREDVEKCLAAGMNDHLGKPINIEELLKKLDQYLLG